MGWGINPREGGVPQGRSGRAENLVPIGIRSRTVQSVVSRYTDRATRFVVDYPVQIPWRNAVSVSCIS